MASQGPNFPTSAANNTFLGSVGWVNVTNIETDDNNSATAVLTLMGDVTNFALGSAFGFSIPAGATINGILLEVKRAAGLISNIDTSTNGAALTKDGGSNFISKNPSDSWPTVLTYQSYGSSSDLWGTTWTPAQINSNLFGAGISATNNGGVLDTASVDAIRVTVFYTPAVLLDWAQPTNQLPKSLPRKIHSEKAVVGVGQAEIPASGCLRQASSR